MWGPQLDPTEDWSGGKLWNESGEQLSHAQEKKNIWVRRNWRRVERGKSHIIHGHNGGTLEKLSWWAQSGDER